VDLEGSQPLTVITSKDIERSGAVSLTELLRTVNQTRGGTGTFNTAQSGATSTSTPPGQAAAALRGMGPSSTLTLVNGRRIAASSFASGTENFVDINSIPLAAIERIEILATGASAIYGADAVAGVINYILKDDFQGFELSAQYGQSEVSADESELGFQAF
jgi:outer membrane cobalamin receptor